MLNLLMAFYCGKRRLNFRRGVRAGGNMIIDAAGSEEFSAPTRAAARPARRGGASRRPPSQF
jgi:hypothetical protein